MGTSTFCEGRWCCLWFYSTREQSGVSCAFMFESVARSKVAEILTQPWQQELWLSGRADGKLDPTAPGQNSPSLACAGGVSGPRWWHSSWGFTKHGCLCLLQGLLRETGALCGAAERNAWVLYNQSLRAHCDLGISSAQNSLASPQHHVCWPSGASSLEQVWGGKGCLKRGFFLLTSQVNLYKHLAAWQERVV